MSLIQPLLGAGAVPPASLPVLEYCGWQVADTVYPTSFSFGKDAHDAGKAPQIWMFISGQSQNGHAPVLPTYDGKAPDISFDVVDGGTWIFGWLLSQYVTIATDILNFDPSSGPLEWNGCVFYQVKVTDGGSAIGVTPPASQPGIQNYPSIAPGSFVIGSGMSIGAEEQTSVDCVPSGGIAQSNGNDSFPATGITRYMIYDVNATAPVNPIPVQFQVTTTGGNLQNYSFILLSSEAL